MISLFNWIPSGPEVLHLPHFFVDLIFNGKISLFLLHFYFTVYCTYICTGILTWLQQLKKPTQQLTTIIHVSYLLDSVHCWRVVTSFRHMIIHAPNVLHAGLCKVQESMNYTIESWLGTSSTEFSQELVPSRQLGCWPIVKSSFNFLLVLSHQSRLYLR